MSIDVLQEKIRKTKNPSMVGLDPSPETVPPHLIQAAIAKNGHTLEALAEAYKTFCAQLLRAFKGIVPAIKVQSACFDALGAPGVAAMQRVLQQAQKLGYYVVLDSMRGDVGVIAALCAQSLFGQVQAGEETFQPYACDGVTLNGYLGGDSIAPFLPYCEKGKKNLFILVKTSNRTSTEVQDLLSGGRLVHTAMADLVNRWGAGMHGKCGYCQVAAVVGATYPNILKTLRSKYPGMFFLVPGYGAQGGTAKGVAGAFDRFGHGAVVSASRSIIAAWKKTETDGRDYVEQAIAAAEKMKKDLAKYTTVM